MRIKPSESSGITILLTGLALLGITFILACIHLQGNINVLPVPRLMSSFGEALSPLIEAAIRVLYLGIMGWIAATVTTKGINLLLHAKLLTKINLHSKPQSSIIGD